MNITSRFAFVRAVLLCSLSSAKPPDQLRCQHWAAGFLGKKRATVNLHCKSNTTKPNFTVWASLPTLLSLACLRALDKSSRRASSSPIPRPSPRSRKRPRRSWGFSTSDECASEPTQLLAHHFSRRCVNSPDSLSWRIAMVRFFTSGEPNGKRKEVWEETKYYSVARFKLSHRSVVPNLFSWRLPWLCHQQAKTLQPQLLAA